MTDPAEAPPCVGSHLSGALVLVGAVPRANTLLSTQLSLNWSISSRLPVTLSSTGYLGSDGHTGLAGQLELLGNQTFPLQGTLTCRTQEAALKVALVSVK